jgi:hypothetical protein
MMVPSICSRCWRRGTRGSEAAGAHVGEQGLEVGGGAREPAVVGRGCGVEVVADRRAVVALGDVDVDVDAAADEDAVQLTLDAGAGFTAHIR